MTRKKKTYRRLPGNILTRRVHFHFFDYTRYRLWLADDHVLHVRRRRFSESYKRFYFKDIQAIILSRTNRGRNWSLIYGFIVACFGMLALATVIWKWPSFFTFFGAFFGCEFAIFMVANIILGHTCVCRLHTNVQVEDLMSIGRLRTARKLINILIPLIEQAQGKLTAEDLDAVSDEPVVVQASAHALADSSQVSQLKHDDGKIHVALFSWMVISSISAAVETLYKGPIKNLADMLIFLGLSVLIVLALTRQTHSDLPRAVKTVTWIALGFTIANYIFGTIYVNIYRATHISPSVQISPLQLRIEGPFYDGYCITVAIVKSLIALAGLILVREFQSKRARSRSAPVTETDSE